MTLKVTTAKEMAAIDQYAIENCGVPGLVLMENAGFRVFEEIVRQFPNLCNKRVVVMAGKGNNGGDGLVVARHLFNNGVLVKVFLFGKLIDLKNEARTNSVAAIKIGIPLVEIDEPNLNCCAHDLRHAEVIVDAIFGTGIKTPAGGIYAEGIKLINSSERPVVSVDMPSGIDSDTGQLNGPHIKASTTIALALPKRSHLLYPSAEFIGKLCIVDISIPRKAIESQSVKVNLIEEKDILSMFQKRTSDSHKGTYGHVLVLAGSKGKGGAAALTSLAALRSGVGLVTLAVPESCHAGLEFHPLEVMTEALPENSSGCLSPVGKRRFMELLEGKSALALGPGISTNPDTIKLLESIMPEISLPLVIDADGLNCLSTSQKLWSQLPSKTILTPHPKEMSRLTQIDIKQILTNKIRSALDLARGRNVFLILKGPHSLIVTPNGSVFINPTGNAGMATAGSGDILTGVIAGFLAQGMTTESACASACYIHGLAGDLQTDETGEASLIAGDMLKILPSAIKRILP